MLEPTAKVELVWQDASGSTAVTTLHVSASLPVAEIESDVSALLSYLLPLTDAVLVKQRIKYIFRTDEPTAPDAGTDIKRVGYFFFTTGDTTAYAAIAVPAIKDSVLLASGPCAGVCIDITDSDVLNLETEVLLANISNPFGDVIEALTTAYMQSRV